MGKVIEMLTKIREMTTQELFDRFKHIVRAQAAREYIAAKEDSKLTLEVNLMGEEVVRRMASGRKMVPVTKKTIKK